MRWLPALIATLASAVPAASSAAGETSLPTMTKAEYNDRLIKVFNDVCLTNAGSWDGMKGAVEASDLGFKAVRGKGHQAIDYQAFPTVVLLRQFGRNFICQVESVVDQTTSASEIASRLKAEGSLLQEIEFKPGKKGEIQGNIPGTGRNTGVGKLFFVVHVLMTKSPFHDTQIAKLAVTF